MKNSTKASLLGITFALQALQSAAFIPTPHTHQLKSNLAAEKNTEEYLRELWQDEKLVEREILVQETISGNENDATKHVVTEMLETALEHLKVLEKEKAKHAKEANDRFERAAQDERVLHEFVEDTMSDDVPVVDNYITSRLHEAEREELEAMEEEDRAVSEYRDLREKEENIKDLLDQMKKMKP